MMRPICIMWTALAALVLTCTASCSLLAPPEVREPVTYDLGIPEPLALPCKVQINPFRMDGAARFKMMGRIHGNQLETDEYHRWIMPPGPMLTRYLRMAFSESKPACGNKEIISGSILFFEADYTRKTAVLSVEYEIRSGNSSVPEIRKTVMLRIPFPEQAASPQAAFAAAMQKAAAALADKLRQELDQCVPANK